MAWFDDVGLSGVKSISFSNKEKVTVKPPELGADSKEKNDDEIFEILTTILYRMNRK